jgi:beta-glucanase (GH16 family)
MMMRTFFFTLILLLTGVGFAGAQQQHLIWHDEFDGQGHPDSSHWNHEVGGHGWGNDELQYYTDRRLKNARVENGKLIIEAHREDYKGSEYTSARLTTKNKGDWVYGRMEVRAKLPSGTGTWPAIWMLPTEWIYGDGSWPDNGEIDIMEHVGYDPGVIHGTIHTDAYNHMQGTQKGGSINISDATESFHVYAIEWNSSEIRWYVDDQLYFTYENEGSGWRVWPFDHPFHMLLNIAIGGAWGGVEGVDNSIFPVRMEVDYVRIYQNPDQIGSLIEGPEQLVPRQKDVTFSTPVLDADAYEWQVPEGAQIKGSSVDRQVTVDWGCQEGPLVCRITKSGTENEINQHITLRDPRLRGPLFFRKDDAPLNFSVEEMTQTAYTWNLPPGATFLSREDSSAVQVDWPEQAGEISVTATNSCGEYTSTHQVWNPNRQYPYPDPEKPAVVPDTLDPTHYDYGGEGVAYHDVTSTNLGPGVRQDEGVDTESLDNGHGSIGWIREGEWLEYSIQVQEETTVKLILRLASEVETDGSVDILINGEEKVGTIQARNTGWWDRFENFETSPFTLSPADTMLRLELHGSEYNLGRVVFSKVETDLEPAVSDTPLQIFPNPSDGMLYLESERPMSQAKVYNLTGVTVKKENLEGRPQKYSLSLQGLPPGAYLVKVKFEDQISVTHKILKR